MENKIIDRIKKLLRLAQSSNVHEAANAAGQAQRLMEEHRIDQAVLDVGDGDGDQAEPDEPIREWLGQDAIHKSARLAQWKVQLTVGLASANACRCYIHNQREICLVGRPSDVATIRYLFTYLVREIDRLCRASCKGEGRIAANSFRLGAVSAIRERLLAGRQEARDAARKKLQGDTVALVRLETGLAKLDAKAREVDDWVKQHMRLRSGRRGGGSARDWSAYERGRQAGQSISLGGGRAAVGSGAKAIRGGK